MNDQNRNENPFDLTLLFSMQLFVKSLEERDSQKIDYLAKMTEFFNAKRKIWEMTNKLSEVDDYPHKGDNQDERRREKW